MWSYTVPNEMEAAALKNGTLSEYHKFEAVRLAREVASAAQRMVDFMSRAQGEDTVPDSLAESAIELFKGMAETARKEAGLLEAGWLMAAK